MNEFQLVPIRAIGPMKDSADFCRPLAAISGVSIDVEFVDCEYAVIQSNALRLQQVSSQARCIPLEFHVPSILTRKLACLWLEGAYKPDLERHQVHC